MILLVGIGLGFKINFKIVMSLLEKLNFLFIWLWWCGEKKRVIYIVILNDEFV